MWSSRWNENWQGKLKYSEETCPTATLSTTNPTWPDLSPNQGRRGGRQETNSLSYGTAYNRVWTPCSMTHWNWINFFYVRILNTWTSKERVGNIYISVRHNSKMPESSRKICIKCKLHSNQWFVLLEQIYNRHSELFRELRFRRNSRALKLRTRVDP
jgi:hypothetical protein